MYYILFLLQIVKFQGVEKRKLNDDNSPPPENFNGKVSEVAKPSPCPQTVFGGSVEIACWIVLPKYWFKN